MWIALVWTAGAVLWGLAEASFFFIVPDVWLTAAAMKLGPRRALWLAALTALAAALAGLGMWAWGQADGAVARAFVLSVPGIGTDLLARAHDEIETRWLSGMMLGAISGVPYKLYAVEAGAQGLSPGLFFAASLIARFCRFALTIGVAAVGRRVLAERWRMWAVGLAWAAVYAGYFTLRLRA